MKNARFKLFIARVSSVRLSSSFSRVFNFFHGEEGGDENISTGAGGADGFAGLFFRRWPRREEQEGGAGTRGTVGYREAMQEERT